MIKTKEETIFNCTDGLFKISQEIYTINPDISNSLLFICDRLLKEIEVGNIEKVEHTHQENCPDCGGIKPNIDTKHQENCPDCGGIKQKSATTPPAIVIDEQDPGSRCNGHSSMGQPKPDTTQTQKLPSEKIQNEVRSLIEEIRKGL